MPTCVRTCVGSTEACVEPPGCPILVADLALVRDELVSEREREAVLQADLAHTQVVAIPNVLP